MTPPQSTGIAAPTDESVAGLVARLGLNAVQWDDAAQDEADTYGEGTDDQAGMQGHAALLREAATALSILAAERDKAIAREEKCERIIAGLCDERGKITADLASAKEALGPFAKAADIKLCGDWRDDASIGRTDTAFRVTFGDLRRARTTLRSLNKEDGRG